MANLLDSLFGRMRGETVKPTETKGAHGARVYGGFLESEEKQSELQGQQKYITFSEILANTSIVAAGVRYFLNLAAKAEWQWEAAEEDRDGRFAELAEEAITSDPTSSWHRVVRRAAMYRFYGFSVQEWTARRHRDGHLTYADIAPRAQSTITRWDVETNGNVRGVVQTSPQTGTEIYLPRSKLVYVVDDSLSDSPEGLGLFRHVVAPAKRLERYEQLEGWGFETDLKGIPIGRGPFAELDKAVTDGKLTDEERAKIEEPLRKFIKNHIASPKLGLLLDSITYKTTDEKQNPSQVRKWDAELLQGDSKSFQENAAAIERLNKEIARILGVEGLLLGAEGTGSLALSKEKSNQLFLIVDSTLKELAEGVRDDLVRPLWQLNGWPEETMPWPRTEGAQFKDVEKIAAALRDMATAGAILDPSDPVVNDVRALLGVSKQPDRQELNAEDSALTDTPAEGAVEDEDEMPKDPAQEGDR